MMALTCSCLSPCCPSEPWSDTDFLDARSDFTSSSVAGGGALHEPSDVAVLRELEGFRPAWVPDPPLRFAGKVARAC